MRIRAFRCKTATTVLFLLLFALPAPGLAQRYHFESFTVDDGLAQSQPTAILEARSGYLWVGTYGGGVSRFDGRTFATFTTKDGLPSNVIFAIAEDHSGDLWFGTDGGVSRYDGARFYPVDSEIAGEVVNAMMVDRQGRLWLGTRNGGLIRRDEGTTIHFTQRDGLPDSTVNALHLDRNGVIWVGTGGGLCRLKTDTIACYTTADGLTDDEVRGIVEDDKGQLWIGTRRGVTVYDGQTFAPARESALHDVDVQTMLSDRDGSVWVGTRDGLVQVFRKLVIAYTATHGLQKRIIRALHEDREGNLWIGSDTDGLIRLTHTPFALFDTRHGMSDEGVWTIVEDQRGHLWFGSDAGGLNRYDGHSFTIFTTADGLSDNRVYVSLKDQAGTLWFGTAKGVSRYDGKQFTTLADAGIDGAVWSMTEDRQGGLWLGIRGEGVFYHKDGVLTQYTAADGLPSNNVRAIFADPNGLMWFGTDGGLARYDGHRFTVLTEADGPGTTMISALKGGADSDIWIGTYGGGVSHYVPEAGDTPLRTFTEDDGLSNAHVVSMTFDDEGDLWICTNNGLNRLDSAAYKTSGAVHFTRYGSEEGFVGVECNAGAAYHDTRGQLWFGTIKGVIRYTPGHGRSDIPEPRTHITNVRLFFEDQDWSPYADGVLPGMMLPADLRLPYTKNHLTFDFVSISLTAPEGVSYQYQLEGIDQDWTPVTQETSATYANLPPGAYTFKVKAANSDGQWNTEAVTYAFVIVPPFWQTLWFFLMAGGAFLLGAYGFVHIRERKLRQHQELLEKKVEERTNELQLEKEKVVQVNETLRYTNLELEQLSLVARETDNAVIITDARGRIEWVNEGFTRMTGYTLETLKRDRGNSIQAVSGNPDIKTAITRVVADKISAIYEAQFCTIDGTERWLNTTLTPIADEAGVVQKLVAIDSDITERKVLEKELKENQSHLVHSERMASLGQLAAGVAHEINNPIGFVTSNLGTLAEYVETFTQLLDFYQALTGQLAPDQRAVLRDILDQIQAIQEDEDLEFMREDVEALLAESLTGMHRVKEIVQGLKSFARLDEADMQIADINEGIEATLKVVWNELKYKAEVHTALGALPRIRCYPGQLNQVFMNLLVNAAHAMEDRGEITITTEAKERDVCVHITDTGCGIAPEHVSQLFNPFFTTKPVGQGTGLGLSISYGIIEKHGGRIEVESEIGCGTTFTIFLPITEGDNG